MIKYKTLIIDIETVGEDFTSLDSLSQESLTKWLKNEAKSEAEYDHGLKMIKDQLGFSPLTGQIVAIGLLDYERDQGMVYFQAPNQDSIEQSAENFKFKSGSEAQIIQYFWQAVRHYSVFVTFNGRQFDAPFLAIRSAVNRVKPTKNLLSNRYLTHQPYSAKHIDLLDQLSFYGSLRRKGDLHLWCRAFGIDSPKSHGVTGHDVAKLFKEKEFLKIAKYNIGDLVATRDLYQYWLDYIKLD